MLKYIPLANEFVSMLKNIFLVVQFISFHSVFWQNKVILSMFTQTINLHTDYAYDYDYDYNNTFILIELFINVLRVQMYKYLFLCMNLKCMID